MLATRPHFRQKNFGSRVMAKRRSGCSSSSFFDQSQMVFAMGEVILLEISSQYHLTIFKR